MSTEVQGNKKPPRGRLDDSDGATKKVVGRE